MDRQELAAFLRSRRTRLTPAETGLPNGNRRRTPGLRREEVAHQAGMSTDYYTRLEQARGPHPSHQILNALARALMLSADERAHLFHLAGEAPAPARGPRRDVPEGILLLLESLDTTPAYVLDAKYDILAWNDALTALWGGVPPERRNMIRWMFYEPVCDVETSQFVRASVADLRAAAGRYPDDPGIRDLVDEMLKHSKEFARLWAEHEVRVRRDSSKSFVHPRFGPVDLRYQVLEVPDRDQRLILYVLPERIRRAQVMVGMGLDGPNSVALRGGQARDEVSPARR